MSLPSRRSLAEARIALGSFDRFLVLYVAIFAAFGVASPFLPALLHARGLGPSEIGAVLAAGTAIRLITGPVISRLADRLGKHQQTLTVFLAMAAVIAFGYSSSRRVCDLPARQCRARFGAGAHCADCRRDDARCSAGPVPIRVGARWGLGCLCRGRRGRWSGCPGNSFGGIVWMNGTLLALAVVAALGYPEMRWIGPWRRGKPMSAPCLRRLASCLLWRWRPWL